MYHYFDWTSFNEFSVEASQLADWGFDFNPFDWFVVTKLKFADNGEIHLKIIDIDSKGDFKHTIKLPKEYSEVLNEDNARSFNSRSWELNVSGNRIFLREFHGNYRR